MENWEMLEATPLESEMSNLGAQINDWICQN